jgi:hypothetical protein
MPHIAAAVFVRCQMVGFSIFRLWFNFDRGAIRCFTHTEFKLTHHPFFSGAVKRILRQRADRLTRRFEGCLFFTGPPKRLSEKVASAILADVEPGFQPAEKTVRNH